MLPFLNFIPFWTNFWIFAVNALQIHTTAMSISLQSPADFHVHLRQGSVSELIVPHVRKGGFDLAYVMVRLTVA